MSTALLELGLFSAKIFITVIFILILLVGILVLLGRGKGKTTGKINVKNINEKYSHIQETLYQEILPKKEFKKYLKKLKATETNDTSGKKKVFVLTFHGDMKASAVTSLSEEITAILSVATPNDEVVVCLESAGGMVHAYGLAAAQLARVRQQHIPLTVIVDKVAASGGYLMASVANKIIAAPFAIIGSIGVIVQLPNFHRLLKEKHVDFEQITAGTFKRTLTLFGVNTTEGREKLQQEVEEIHQLFKNAIQQYRPQIDILKVATGEHWLGMQALELKLIDEIKTSDDYLHACSKEAHLFKISYQSKKSWLEKLTTSANLLMQPSIL